MDPLELQLRPTNSPLRPTVAWRMRGGDPQQWLDQIVAWDAPHRLIEWAPLPTSARDRAVGGILIRCKSDGLSHASPPAPSAVAYGQIAARIFLPVTAQLWPPVEEQELTKLIATRSYVFQPESGLVALELDPWQPLAKLIARPEWTLGDWETPNEGLILAPRITALRAELPPDPEEIMNSGQEDIGSKTDSADQMPRSPHESEPGALNVAKDQAQKLAAGAAGAVSKVLPGSWSERLGAWAERQQARADRRTEANRNKELERLMNLMENDPDEALKYAPPLSSDVAHRGQAEPSGQLGERDPTFDFARLSSGGPAEAWDVDGAYYYKLRMQYREAANRELQLKRYRRAAYIFAELLGDHSAAAGALFSGKFYREAAALYQKKLGQPRRAAKCLEQGGMLTDAIELYLQLEMYEKAGDLCQQLNQPDEAREHYLQAVDAMQILGPQRDHLAISVLLEKKLQMQEAAMAELAEAWPGSTQPVACMRRWFDLAQHQAAPPEILQQIDRVANVSPALAFASAEVLFHVATTQQQEAVGAARNALQTLVAKSLLEVQPTRRNQLVSYLQRLDPADRLLIRDSRNFLERRAKRLAPPEAAPAKRVGRNTLVKRTELPPRTHWSSLCLLDDVLFIAGLRGGSLAVVAAPWGGDAANVELPWPKTMMSPATEIVLTAHSHEDSLILLHPVINRVAGHPLPLRPLRGITRRPKLQVGSATAGITIDTLSVCRGPHGLIWQASYTGSQLVLACYRGDQMVSSRVVIEAAELELPSELPRLSTNGTNVFLSWGEHLFIAATDKQEVLHDMPQEIRRLACSAPHSRPRVAMGYDVGGSILWNQQLDFKLLPFGEGLVNPEVCINRGGFLVAAGAKRIEVYSTRNTTLKLIGENEESSLNPVAVIGGPGSHQFAVLNDNRELLWYETA